MTRDRRADDPVQPVDCRVYLELSLPFLTSMAPLVSSLTRLFCGRRETLPDGEIRVALNAPPAQMFCGTGYFNMLGRTVVHPPVLEREYHGLYLRLHYRVREVYLRWHNRLAVGLIVTILPFVILLGIGNATNGFNNNPLFALAFALSFLAPLFLMAGPYQLPRFRALQDEKDREIDKVVEEYAPEFESKSRFILTLEEDMKFPRLKYLCFREKRGLYVVVETDQDGDMRLA